MYRRIVVALDGSAVAEQVLPHVEALAAKFGSSVTLLRAVTPIGTVMAELSGPAAGGEALGGPLLDPVPIVDAERQEDAQYLHALAARLGGRGYPVDVATPEGSPSQAVVTFAEEHGADLIALTTHGRGGLGRALFGSVADAVLRHAPCPVLLVRVRVRDDGGSREDDEGERASAAEQSTPSA